jgi:hypothetical protein
LYFLPALLLSFLLPAPLLILLLFSSSSSLHSSTSSTSPPTPFLFFLLFLLLLLLLLPFLLLLIFYFSSPTTCHTYIVVSPHGCGLNVTDLWVWDANRAQLRCPDDVNDDTYERGVPGGPLNLNSTGYPDHGAMGIFSCMGKFTRQNWESNPVPQDHQVTRLVVWGRSNVGYNHRLYF